MRRAVFFCVVVSIAFAVGVSGETFRNDTNRTVVGFWIAFPTPVTITAIDDSFPHQRPEGRSRDFSFEGWPLRPNGVIRIRWSPSTTEPEAFGWITQPTPQAAPADGIIDDFTDGDTFSSMGVAWSPNTFYGGVFRIPLEVECITAECSLILSKAGVSGMTSVSQHFERPVDASVFDGLYLRLAASKPLSVNVELMCKDPACEYGNKFTWVGESAYVSETTREFRMPFEFFVSDPGECPDTERLLDRTRIQNLGIYILPGSSGDLQIHEVGFYSSDDPSPVKIVILGGD